MARNVKRGKLWGDMVKLTQDRSTIRCEIKRSKERKMNTKSIYIIFGIAILMGLIFTVQGILASAPLFNTSERQLPAIKADADRLNGLANRYILSKPLEAERQLRINAAQADRLAAAAEYYSVRTNRINAAQSARLNISANHYALRQARITQALAGRWTAAAKHYSQSLQAQLELEKRVRDAEAARWTEIAAHYLADNP